MNADGTDQTNISNNPAHDTSPQFTKMIEDPDGDCVNGLADNCPLVANPDQADNEADGQGNACDPDDDNDLTLDESDNCPFTANPYRIAFGSTRTAGNNEIYSMNHDGTNPLRLTNHPLVDQDPSFSSDGSRIVFTSTRLNSRLEIYAMNADGTQVTRLTNIAGSNCTASFSPDGTRITFLSNRDNNFAHIYVMNADGTDQTRLTPDRPSRLGGSPLDPTFNHDGTRIVFGSDRGSIGDPGQDIFTIELHRRHGRGATDH